MGVCQRGWEYMILVGGSPGGVVVGVQLAQENEDRFQTRKMTKWKVEKDHQFESLDRGR